MKNENLYTELKNGIDELQKNLEKNHLHPSKGCLTIAVNILLDSRVQNEFITLLKQDYIFDNLRCERFGIDQTKVFLIFRCKPPKICFTHPGLEVTYDHSLNQVTNVTIVFF